MGEAPTGMDLVISWEPREGAAHPRLHVCDGCGESVLTTGVVELGYYFQTCGCELVEFPHLVQRVCHLRCMARHAPDLLAVRMLRSASFFLGGYRKGERMAVEIDEFLRARDDFLQVRSS